MDLKDVGTDLVANLKLFTQFSHASEEIADWWVCVKTELAPGRLHVSTSESKPGDQFALWSNIKENLWEYYTVVCTCPSFLCDRYRTVVFHQVNVAQQQFPNLLGQSIAAWQLAASVSDPNIRSREVGQDQKSSPTRGPMGRLLSRVFNLKRTSNIQGGETAINGRDLTPSKPNKDANIASGSSNLLPGDHAPNKNRKMRFLKGCISAGLICN